jgi:hypothetical protein
VVSRSGKARAVPAPRVPSRIANRSAADQAHRDKLAKQWKTVEKPARRAAAISKATTKAAAGLPPAYPRLSRLRKIGGHSRYIRENIDEQTARLMRSPSRGKNKLTPQQRGQIVSDAVASARSLRARAAMTTPRRTTLRVRGARLGGTIAKPKGLKPGAIKPKATPKPKASRSPATSRLRPGELMNAVARPVGTMARPRKGENPFGTKDKTKKQNLSIALSWLNSKGFKGQLYSEGAKLRGQAIARFIPSTPVVRYNKDGSQSRVITQGELQLNQSNNYWRNPRSSNTRNRATGFLSTSSPVGTLYHEIGHSRDKRLSLPGYVRNWGTAYSGTKQETKAIARRVSRYATTNPAEFIAETYAGLKTGRRYDFQVMRAYREAMGLSPNPAARRRSRVRRPKP